MKNIGDSQKRNKEFNKKFNRDQLILDLVGTKKPIIFDVGAHFGESIDYLKGLFLEPTIYSFEPDPDSFDILTSKSLSGVKCFNIALASKEGESTFFRNKISHTNSLFRVNVNSKDSIGVTNAKAKGDDEYFNDFNSEIKVKTTTLDTFQKNHSLGIVDLIKIDVQGAECEVLKGGSKFLLNARILIIEISFFDYYENQTSFLDVESLISPLNFRLFSISEISNNPMNGRTDWVEAIYVNKNLM
jgi:FkbM family methyltransferase